MGSHEEYRDKARVQFERLREEWSRLYLSAQGDSDVAVDIFAEDAKHSPPAIRTFVTNALDEVMDSVADKLTEEFPDDQVEALSGNPAYGFAMSAVYLSAKVLAIRCFEMGSTLHDEMPYNDLVPCPCKSNIVDDVEAFLASQNDLVGDGWIIKNFDRHWAHKAKGKAHWLRKEV